MHERFSSTHAAGFEAVSKLDCIKPYLLVGGTALSLQMGTRQSEDLDFMKWRTSKTEKMEVAWYQIEKEARCNR